MKRLGMANTVHLDEATPEDLAGEVVSNLDKTEQGSSEMLVLFCSSQNLTANKTLCDGLIHCRGQRIMRLVSLDKAHLWAMHGAVFLVTQFASSAMISLPPSSWTSEATPLFFWPWRPPCQYRCCNPSSP